MAQLVFDIFVAVGELVLIMGVSALLVMFGFAVKKAIFKK